LPSRSNTITGVPTVEQQPPIERLHRFTLPEYHRLIRAGAFHEDARVELIDGWLLDISPKTPEHENAVAWLARWLMFALDPAAYTVRVTAPLAIGRSEPEPDLSVIAGQPDRHEHPSTARMVIEVAHTSLAYDLHDKLALYAAARVEEYWVIDLDGRRAIRHTGPSAGAYRDVRAYSPGEKLPGGDMQLPDLAVREVLRAAGVID
jgi:Uma2 family endonuclease